MRKQGLIRPTYNPLYRSQAFLVPKTGPDKYRIIVDMKKLNQQTLRTSLMMPNLEQQVSYSCEAKFFGSFHVLSGFNYFREAVQKIATEGNASRKRANSVIVGESQLAKHNAFANSGLNIELRVL